MWWREYDSDVGNMVARRRTEIPHSDPIPSDGRWFSLQHTGADTCAGANVMMPSGIADVKEEDLGDARSPILPERKLVKIENPIDLYSLNLLTDIGRGSYGKVVLASDPVSKELLALKIMEKSCCDEETFSTELKVLSIGADCRFITSLRGFVETSQDYIIAMEAMAGGDLFSQMLESMKFDIETTRRFAAEMVCGMQFLHEHGVIVT
ncbi:protein kinase C-like 1B [Dendrobates tinctorius]|uniref:protein kinase C-like 1B n=1 Tax=Dendrobates tinctorius TaxID=92724 RepID=UPI003CCA3FC0